MLPGRVNSVRLSIIIVKYYDLCPYSDVNLLLALVEVLHI